MRKKFAYHDMLIESLWQIMLSSSVSFCVYFSVASEPVLAGPRLAHVSQLLVPCFCLPVLFSVVYIQPA